MTNNNLRYYSGILYTLPDNGMFVFGSNLAGRHGKGAALTARKYFGAKLGVGIGLTGKSYAIPTKGYNLEILSLDIIYTYIRKFIEFSMLNPTTDFYITKVGCGLAGYSISEISSLFQKAINGHNCSCKNLVFSDEFKPFLEK